jgi:TPP-dependent pyruvate/acetoin dehydrogenase alpha subunit
MLSNPLTKEEFMEEKKKEKNFVEEVLSDYRICCISREASLLARREVLTGKAKFGIIGDGKEVPQVAMARAFKKGDFRSGYYRDQTLMFALGLSTLEEFFAQLYADTENDPFSSGRQMNSHYATPFIDKEGGLAQPSGKLQHFSRCFLYRRPNGQSPRIGPSLKEVS